MMDSCSSLFWRTLFASLWLWTVNSVYGEQRDDYNNFGRYNNNNNNHNHHRRRHYQRQDRRHRRQLLCFDSTTDLYEAMLAASVNNESEPAEYILCENTTFEIGELVNDSTGSGSGGGGSLVSVQNGMMPLFAKSQTTISCGTTGEAANGCILNGGKIQFLNILGVFPNDNDAAAKDVFIKGITFQAAQQTGIFLVRPGNLQFEDCVIKDQVNLGPVLAIYAGPGRRNRQRRLSVGNTAGTSTEFDISSLLVAGLEESLIQMEEEDHEQHVVVTEQQPSQEYQHEDGTIILSTSRLGSSDDHRRRRTQQEETSEIQRVVFWKCRFENNAYFQAGSSDGVVTFLTSYNKLIVRDTLFYNNQYGTDENRNTYAILIVGSNFTMINNCFIDNDFNGMAPVHVITDSPMTASIAVDNYGTVDDTLCQFAAHVRPSTGKVTCANYTAVDTCGLPYDVPEPSGSQQPPTPAPSDPPTDFVEPECYTDTTQLYERLRQADPDVLKTYTLCPDTTFNIGTREYLHVWENGQAPLVGRSNTVYRCGGSNCVLTGGTNQFISSVDQFPQDEGGTGGAVNVRVEGITFQNAAAGNAILLNNVGDVTFRDCVIKEHSNDRPVMTNYDGPGKLDVTFEDCTFEDNVAPASTGPIDTSVIMLATSTADLTIATCRFVDNVFNDPLVVRNGAAILSFGSTVQIRDSCFIDNYWMGAGTVFVTGDSEVVSQNNYGTTTSSSSDGSSLLCDYIAKIESGTSGTVNCSPFEATQCFAT